MTETPVVTTVPPLVTEETSRPKFQRARHYAKFTFVHVGVPLALGAVAFYATKKLSGQTIVVDIPAIAE